jgi:hypothetical protein
MSEKCITYLKSKIEEVLIPDMIEYIDELFEEISNNKNASQENKDNLKEIQSMKAEFEAVVKDLDNGELEEDECMELLEEVNIMLKIRDSSDDE